MGTIINLQDYIGQNMDEDNIGVDLRNYELSNPDKPISEWDASDFREIFTMIRAGFPDDEDYAWEFLYECIKVRAGEATTLFKE